MIPLVYCHIKSFQRASSMKKLLPGGEKRRDGRAAHHVEWGGDWVVSPPVCATGVSLIARGCLIGATPRGSAVDVLCSHVHRELMRSALLDLTPIIPATACHQRNYVERYSRSRDRCRVMRGYRSYSVTTSSVKSG